MSKKLTKREEKALLNNFANLYRVPDSLRLRALLEMDDKSRSNINPYLLSENEIKVLTDLSIRGLFGNGQDRMNRLGEAMYPIVQLAINDRVNPATTKPGKHRA